MGRKLGPWRWAVVGVVLALAAACSGHDGDDGDGAAAARVAKAYATALGNAQWEDAYSMLLPRQRHAVDYLGLYRFCSQQDDSTGDNGKASARTVRDAVDVTPPAYSRDLPTAHVAVTIRYPMSDPAPRGRIRVSNDGGRWYVSLSDAAFAKYAEENCPMDAVWEYRQEPQPTGPLPTANPAPVSPPTPAQSPSARGADQPATSP